jgi:MFS family permease
VAAFGLSASIFAMILYLVLYLQDILGYSALGTGVRMTVMSGGMFVAATVAGRASAHVPVRLLIGAGLIGGGVGMLLMRGLGPASSWTHLIPGLILGGVGAGLVNPPLASTAVGVVRPERAGMASGINSTFRQVGIATGIAVLGTMFSHTVTDQVQATIGTVPGLSGRAAQVVGAVHSGQTGRLLEHLPPRTAQAVALVTRSAFTAGLNQILLVAAIIAFASGLVSLAAIRGQDLVAPGPGPVRRMRQASSAGSLSSARFRAVLRTPWQARPQSDREAVSPAGAILRRACRMRRHHRSHLAAAVGTEPPADGGGGRAS